MLAVCWGGVAHAEGPPTSDASSELAAEATGEASPAPEPTTAREWYDRGIELGSAGDFVAAAHAFLRSYEQQPTSEALYNAGFAYQRANDPVAAIETYRRLLAEPERNEELARAAEQAIARLLREVGTLKAIRHAPDRPPAELYVAGERVELDQLPLVLPPGPVSIEVVDEQGVRARETYELAAGEALVVDLRALLPPPAEPPEPDDRIIDNEDRPTPEQLQAARTYARRAKQLRLATWVGLGLTGAAGISAGTLAGLSVREREAYLSATCFEFDGNCPDHFPVGDPERHFVAYNRMQIGMIVSASVGGGFAIGSLVVGLVSLRLERKAARERTRVRVEPRLGGFAISF